MYLRFNIKAKKTETQFVEWTDRETDRQFVEIPEGGFAKFGGGGGKETKSKNKPHANLSIIPILMSEEGKLGRGEEKHNITFWKSCQWPH